MRAFAGALLALIIFAAPATEAASAAKSKPAPQPALFCKTVKGEWVSFSEGAARQEAESRLDQALSEWGKHYSIAEVKPRDRKTGCRFYLKILNEYLCTAEAVVCR